MADKEIIKQDIERRIEKYGPDFKTPYDAMYQLLTLLDFIDSIPEESTSEDLEEEIDRCWEGWIDPNPEVKGVDGYLSKDEFSVYARHFAEWQKQKDQETIELAEEHAMLAGMEKMREEMMKDAVDATILDIDAQTIEFGLWPEKLLDIKEGDKIKIIIIKEN